MPMLAKVASGSITGSAGIGNASPQRLWTTATTIMSGNDIVTRGAGIYGLAWTYGVNVVGSAAGTNAPPMFTWWDANAATSITSTGGAIGNLLGAGSATALSGQASGNFGLNTSATGFRMHGWEIMFCASGGSGASAYFQVSASGAGGATARFDYSLFLLDAWSV